MITITEARLREIIQEEITKRLIGIFSVPGERGPELVKPEKSDTNENA